MYYVTIGGVKILKRPIYIKGADVSWLQYIEENGENIYIRDQKSECLKILKENGISYIRLRIWNNPKDKYCGKEATLKMAKKIIECGFKFLLEIHYTDFWANPNKQTKPEEWRNLTFEELKKAVYDYTKDIVCALDNQGTLPDFIRINRESIWGMLWPEDKPDYQNDSDIRWKRFSELLNSGINGIKDSIEKEQKVKIMIHETSHQGQSRYMEDLINVVEEAVGDREKDIFLDIIEEF